MRLLLAVGLALSVTPAGLAEIYLVTPDGTGDFPTIQAAIDAATDGDIVELADGAFAGDGNHNLDFLGKSITLRALNADPERCVIDCHGEAYPGETHRGLFFRSGEGPGTIVQGITIANGAANAP